MYENSSKSFLFSEMLIRQRLKDKFLHEFWFSNLLKRSANKQKQLYFDLKADWIGPPRIKKKTWPQKVKFKWLVNIRESE